MFTVQNIHPIYQYIQLICVRTYTASWFKCLLYTIENKLHLRPYLGNIFLFFKLEHTWWVIYEWLTIAYWKYWQYKKQIGLKYTLIDINCSRKKYFLKNRRHYFSYLCGSCFIPLATEYNQNILMESKRKTDDITFHIYAVHFFFFTITLYYELLWIYCIRCNGHILCILWHSITY